MYSTIMTSMRIGIRAVPVRVEVDIRAGLPAFEMVGFLSSEVREARERVRTALHNCGIALPAKRITVNLSPANIKKKGTGFDLAIAVALLAALGILGAKTAEFMYVGELNLRGDILPVSGILPIVADAGDFTGSVIVPSDSLQEAKLAGRENILGFGSLPALLAFLGGAAYEEPVEVSCAAVRERPVMDFSEINGQPFLRRVAEVAAAGMHNMLMVGPPGAGKTMIAERMATILPPLSGEERLELAKIYSVRGALEDGRMPERPFRSPHHTISRAGLVGGGAMLSPGEISLAHKGVLFLDELTEFDKTALETLRQPMEEHEVHLVKSAGSVDYPSDFLLLAAMNPCSCGYYPDMQKCRCTPAMLQRYLGRLSRPLADRMDICVEAPVVTYQELMERSKNESSAEIRKRVEECHSLQRIRYAAQSFSCNSRIPAGLLEEYCPLKDKELCYMEQMYDKLQLTARSCHKILRVARTVADLDHCERIGVKHLAEAVCYRSMDEKFWGGI
ncbi:MAG: YifB family Mg chelatase-like AAA ATPase [Muribaculaceae bacterium]|nr:YifB family Mg chelatase-like AAA ATPase [Roseburia sp.]MCM1431086.1 YifB family Mg chelatase-like AAA ATPase [Muribaculaceae bacterium]MCM1493346.1 YifB family Mg chelatase-like AAA ATPase [Muribaculaceae bacterium]